MQGRLAERAAPWCPAGSGTDAPALASIPDAVLHLRARALFIVLFLSALLKSTNFDLATVSACLCVGRRGFFCAGPSVRVS